MTLPRASGAEFSFVHSSEVLATNSRLIRIVGKPENPEGVGGSINVMGINCPHEKVRLNASSKSGMGAGGDDHSPAPRVPTALDLS